MAICISFSHRSPGTENTGTWAKSNCYRRKFAEDAEVTHQQTHTGKSSFFLVMWWKYEQLRPKNNNNMATLGRWRKWIIISGVSSSFPGLKRAGAIDRTGLHFYIHHVYACTRLFAEWMCSQQGCWFARSIIRHIFFSYTLMCVSVRFVLNFFCVLHTPETDGWLSSGECDSRPITQRSTVEISCLFW